MKYKFIGKPDIIFPHLKTGRIYDLEIKKNNFITRFFTGVSLIIISPIVCPYSTKESFINNWKLIK